MHAQQHASELASSQRLGTETITAIVWNVNYGSKNKHYRSRYSKVSLKFIVSLCVFTIQEKFIVKLSARQRRRTSNVQLFFSL